MFLTAGACGPCRFGMYVTEYRKALRDAGFDGFRVMLFQQKGGLKQATGDERRPRDEPDVLHGRSLQGDPRRRRAQRHRLPPAPLRGRAGRDRHARSRRRKKIVYDALENERTSSRGAAGKAGAMFGDGRRSTAPRPKPQGRIIGEFWAMTTEGDGNYQPAALPRAGGRRVRHPVRRPPGCSTCIWEGRYDTKQRARPARRRRRARGLGGVGRVRRRPEARDRLRAATRRSARLFQTFAHAVGLYGYHLPDMDEIAEVGARRTTTTTSAAAKATWRSAS